MSQTSPETETLIENLIQACVDYERSERFEAKYARLDLEEAKKAVRDAITAGHAQPSPVSPETETVIMPENPPDMILAWLSNLRGYHTQSEHANAGRRRYALMRAEIAALAKLGLALPTSTKHD